MQSLGKPSVLLCLVGGLMALTACNEHPVRPFAENIKAEQADIQSSLGAAKVDILWVVDNSGSMCEEQQSLRENFNSFVQELVDIGADFQLAVITTDMVDPEESGRFQNTPDGEPGPSCDLTVNISDCPSAANGQEPPSLVIKSSDYEDENGVVDVQTLQRDFGCNATTGTRGNGFEMGLEAAKTALSPALLAGHNSGFLRDGAFLGVVFLTDENDCSDRGALDKTNGNVCEWEENKLVNVQEYIDFFLSLKGNDPSKIIMAGIVAPDAGIRYQPGDEVQPSCFSDFGGDGFAGYRYEQVINAFDNRATSNICEPPFDNALLALGTLFREAVDVSCLKALPTTCEGDAQCPEGQTCAARGAGARKFCSGFSIRVEVRRPTPIDARECEELTGTNGTFSCILEEGVDYSVNYNDTTCTSSISINLEGFAPGANDEVLVRYPRAVGEETEEPAPEDQ